LFFEASQWAAVAPTLPEPTTVTFLRINAKSSGREMIKPFEFDSYQGTSLVVPKQGD
jgi:hypothetical protein